jgi:hypothetical protein
MSKRQAPLRSPAPNICSVSSELQRNVTEKGGLGVALFLQPSPDVASEFSIGFAKQGVKIALFTPDDENIDQE